MGGAMSGSSQRSWPDSHVPSEQGSEAEFGPPAPANGAHSSRATPYDPVGFGRGWSHSHRSKSSHTFLRSRCDERTKKRDFLVISTLFD